MCALWDWRNAAGHSKDMAARTLLLKLERADCIALPARQRPSVNARRNLHIAPAPAPEEPISGAPRDLQPLGVTIAKPIHDATLKAICTELNATEIGYPGTTLRLVYRPIRSSVFPTGQDV